MSGFFGAPGDLGSLDDQTLTQRHSELQSHLRIIRRVIPLAILLIIFGFVMNMKSTVESINGDELAGAFEKRATTLGPAVQRTFDGFGDEVAPALSKSFEAEMGKALDKLGNNLDGEMNRLEKELPAKLAARMQTRLDELTEKQNAALGEHFPALKGDKEKRVLLQQAFRDGFSEWARKMLIGTFHRHVAELENIKRTLNKVVAQGGPRGAAKAAKAAKGADGESAGARAERIQPEQLLSLWLEIVEVAVGGGPDETDLFAAPNGKN
jgi:hypothetical protein